MGRSRMRCTAAVVLAISMGLSTAVSNDSFFSCTRRRCRAQINATGTNVTLSFPTRVSSVTLKLWGASGGSGRYSSGRWSGAGGFTVCVFKPNDTLKLNGFELKVRVGTGGKYTQTPGWPAGGWGKLGDVNAGGGGGRTEVRLSTPFNDPIEDIIAVAGGGGGATGYHGNAGAGGGTVGQSAYGYGGTGGNQTAGGYDKNRPQDSNRKGSFLCGGNGGAPPFFTNGGDDGGGGGDGYFGGGGGGGDAQPGGGGSGFVSSVHCELDLSATYTGNQQTPPTKAINDTDYPGNSIAWGVESNSVDGNDGHFVVIYDRDATASPTICPTVNPTSSPSTLNPITASPTTHAPTQNPTTSQPTTEGPMPISARFADSLSTIDVHFNVPTDTPTALSSMELCTMLFDAATLRVIKGDQYPQCYWASNTRISIHLGRNFLATPGRDKVVVKSGYIRREGAGSDEPTTFRTELVISPPKTPPPVTVSIVGMESIGPCNPTVELVASGSGNAGRDFEYSWTYLGSSVTHNNSFFVNINNLTSSANDRVLVVPTSEFKMDSKHTFNVTIRNWLGMSSSAVHSIHKGEEVTPVVRLPGPTRISIKRSQHLEVPVQVRKAECDTANGTQNMLRTVATWSQIGGPSQIVIPDPFSSYLRVPPRVLEMYGQYAFQILAVTRDHHGNSVGSTNVTFLVIVEEEPVKAVISGGSSRLVSLSKASPLTFSAKGSADPAYPLHGLRFNWSLVDLKTSASIPMPNLNLSSASLNIRRDVLHSNVTYLLELNVTSLAASRPRHTVTFQRIRTTDDSIPEVEILTAVKLNVNIRDKLVLSVVLEPSDAEFNETSLSKVWICTSGNLNLSDPSILKSSTNDRNLIFKPYALLPGTDFVFSVRVKPFTAGSNSVWGEASVTISTNSLPSLGVCSSTPSSGTALVTSFRLACHGWTDKDLPLTYKFEIATSSHTLAEAKFAESLVTNDNRNSSINGARQRELPIYLSVCDFRRMEFYDTVLSENPYGASSVIIRALVADFLGANSPFLFEARVDPLPPARLTTAKEIMESRLQEGDMQNYAVFAGGIAAQINSPSVELDIDDATRLRVSVLETVSHATANSTSARVLPPQTSAVLIERMTAANRSGEINTDAFDFALDVISKVVVAAGETKDSYSKNQDESELAAPLSRGIANLLFSTKDGGVPLEASATVEKTLANLSSSILASTVIGEDASTLTSANAQDGSTMIHLTGRLIQGSDLENASLVQPSTGSSVLFQPSPGDRTQSALQLSAISVEGSSIYSSPGSRNSILGGTTFIEVRDARTGSRLRTRNTTRPIKFTIPRVENVNYTSSSMKFWCAYWNGSTWSTEGVQMVGVDEETGLPMCQSNHLTPFSVLGREIRLEVNTIQKEDVTDFRALDPTKNPIMAVVLVVFVVALALFPCLRFYDQNPKLGGSRPTDKTATDEDGSRRIFEILEDDFWREVNTAQYLHTEARSTCNGWQRSSWIAIKRRHTWLSIWFRHPGDYLNSQKRLVVLLLLIMNSAVVCALLEGTTNKLPFLSGRSSKAIVACLISFPVPFVIAAILSREPPKKFQVNFAPSRVAAAMPWLFLLLSVCAGDSVDSINMNLQDEEDDGALGGEGENQQEEDLQEEKNAEKAEEDEDLKMDDKEGSPAFNTAQAGATMGAIGGWTAGNGKHSDSSSSGVRPNQRLSADSRKAPKDDCKNFIRSQSMAMHSSSRKMTAPSRQMTFLGLQPGCFVRNHEWTRKDLVAMVAAMVHILGCAYILVIISWSLRDKSSIAAETMMYCFGQDAAFRFFTILAVETILLLSLSQSQGNQVQYIEEDVEPASERRDRVVTCILSSDVPTCMVDKHGRVISITENGVVLGIQKGWKILRINGRVVDTEKMRRKATLRAHAMGAQFEVTFDTDAEEHRPLNLEGEEGSVLSRFHSGIDPDPKFCFKFTDSNLVAEPEAKRRSRLRFLQKTILFRNMSECSFDDSMDEQDGFHSSISEDEPGFGVL